MIDVFDSIFHGAEVDIRHRDAIPEVHLDECPLDVTLKDNTRGKGVSTWLLRLQGRSFSEPQAQGCGSLGSILGACVCVMGSL